MTETRKIDKKSDENPPKSARKVPFFTLCPELRFWNRISGPHFRPAFQARISGPHLRPSPPSLRREETRPEESSRRRRSTVGRRAKGATSLSPATMVCSSPGRRMTWSNDCCDDIFMWNTRGFCLFYLFLSLLIFMVTGRARATYYQVFYFFWNWFFLLHHLEGLPWLSKPTVTGFSNGSYFVSFWREFPLD